MTGSLQGLLKQCVDDVTTILGVLTDQAETASTAGDVSHNIYMVKHAYSRSDMDGRFYFVISMICYVSQSLQHVNKSQGIKIASL